MWATWYLVLHEYVPGANDDVGFPVPTEVPVYQGQATKKHYEYVTYPLTYLTCGMV